MQEIPGGHELTLMQIDRGLFEKKTSGFRCNVEIFNRKLRKKNTKKE